MTRDDAQAHELQDDLTGLPARALVLDRLASALSLATWQGRPIVVFAFRVAIQGGDEVASRSAVREALSGVVAHRIASVIRPHDTLGVLGDGAFVVLVTGLATLRLERILGLVRRILRTIAEPIEIEGERQIPEGHVGISLFPEDAGTAPELLRLAEAACADACAPGERAWQFASVRLDAVGTEEARLVGALRRSVLRSEFSLRFDPWVRPGSWAPSALRVSPGWDAPESDGVSGSRILELADELDLGQVLEQWMLDRVIACLFDWSGTGLDGIPVFLTIAPAQFTPGLPERVQQALRRTRCDPRLLGFAVAEKTLLADIEVSRQVIEALRGLGCPVQVSDAAGGFASLRLLRRLALTGVVLPVRAFVSGIDGAVDDTLLRGIGSLIDALGLQLILEGVDDPGMLPRLRDCGIHSWGGAALGVALDGQALLQRFASQRTVVPFAGRPLRGH
jgi:EAL domain-containing protein (putative c-di-GMP-specific phosphodiesterase class I)/GGDEF domain-containing protein